MYTPDAVGACQPPNLADHATSFFTEGLEETMELRRTVLKDYLYAEERALIDTC